MVDVTDAAAAVGRRLELLTIGRLGGRPFSVGMDAHARPAPKATGRSHGWRRAGAFWVGNRVVHRNRQTTTGSTYRSFNYRGSRFSFSCHELTPVSYVRLCVALLSVYACRVRIVGLSRLSVYAWISGCLNRLFHRASPASRTTRRASWPRAWATAAAPSRDRLARPADRDRRWPPCASRPAACA